MKSRMLLRPLAGLALAGAAFAQPATVHDHGTPRDPVVSPGGEIPDDPKEASAQARKAGDVAPRTTFRDRNGETVSLDSLLEDGPLVLIFYRGSWCPFCVASLAEVSERRAEIERAGARIVAVSPEVGDFAQSIQSKGEITFPIYSDPEAVAGRAFGVAWQNERYGKSLERFNGNDRGELPLGATYVIRRDGRIAWSFTDPNYRERATPDQIIAAVKAIDG